MSSLIIACLLVGGLLAIGQRLRDGFAVFERIYIPASVIAGTVGLAVVQTADLLSPPPLIALPLDLAAASLRDWPGVLIAVVFAAMLLQRSSGAMRLGFRATGSEALMVWIIALGQTAIGVTLTWLIIQPLYPSLPNAFGMLIETGFAGGHGTAAAMGQVFATPAIDFPSGRDLGMLMATVGLVYGTISGIFWINFVFRSRWSGYGGSAVLAASDASSSHGPEAADETGPPHSTKAAEETWLIRYPRQFAWIAAAFLIGSGGQWLVGESARWWDSIVVATDTAADSASAEPTAGTPTERNRTETVDDSSMSGRLRMASLVGSFPLFIYTLFGGWLVSRALMLFGRPHWMDGVASGRISTWAMDLLVVAAITTLNLEAVAALLFPVTVLFVGGSLWSAVCLLILSPRILPRSHWFELGLINYGMSTGTTATGFVLLRLVDPQLRSDAAKHYALAAPLSAPFVGGGLVTIGLPLLFLSKIPIGISAITLCLIVAILIGLAMRIGRSSMPVTRNATVD